MGDAVLHWRVSNQMKLFFYALIAAGAFLVGAQTKWVPTREWFEEPKLGARPKAGYVPNRKAAIKIGETVLEAQYGIGWVKDGAPFDAKLFDDVWIVYSSHNSKDKNGDPMLGGPTVVEISKTSGTILGTYLRL